MCTPWHRQSASKSNVSRTKKLTAAASKTYGLEYTNQTITRESKSYRRLRNLFLAWSEQTELLYFVYIAHTPNNSDELPSLKLTKGHNKRLCSGEIGVSQVLAQLSQLPI